MRRHLLKELHCEQALYDSCHRHPTNILIHYGCVPIEWISAVLLVTWASCGVLFALQLPRVPVGWVAGIGTSGYC